MTELTEISGVGPSRAETIAEAGYESAEDVAAASVEDLKGVEDLPDHVVEDVHEGALDLLEVDEDESDAEDESEGEEAPEDEPEEEEDESDDVEDDTPDTRDLEFDMLEDEEVQNHLLKGLLDHQIRERKRSNIDRIDLTTDMVDQVKAYDGTLTLEDEQIHILFTSAKDIKQEYLSQRGLDDLMDKMDDLVDEIRDVRQDLF